MLQVISHLDLSFDNINSKKVFRGFFLLLLGLLLFLNYISFCVASLKKKKEKHTEQKEVSLGRIVPIGHSCLERSAFSWTSCSANGLIQ